MNIDVKKENNVEAAIITSDDIIISDIHSALDLVMTIKYETNCNRIIINKEAINEDFFDLKTGLAGEILQKFINYYVKIAIFGDYSKYTSKSLKDFIYECNKGKNAFFVQNIEQAIEKIVNA